MAPTGRGKQRILIVGEAPGRNEDKRGMQFCGKAGLRLERELDRVHIDMRKDCILTNSLICRPPNNAKPSSKQIKYCQPNFIKTLEEVNPDIVIPLGDVAAKCVISYIWKEDGKSSMTKWAGWRIPSQKPNVWICPTYHPSFLERQAKPDPVLDRFFHQHLKKAVACQGKPWKEVPDFESGVECILDDHQAEEIILQELNNPGELAFDYETNMLKPDGPKRRIVSCSICFAGERTIAYPWHKKAIKATQKLLQSKLHRKVASNMKFEERWTLAEFGHGVEGWDFDTMLGAHWLDSRAGITSIKFQAFVLFGAQDWTYHIERFLKSDRPNEINRIHEIDLSQLLKYNGLDSLWEYKVSRKMKKDKGGSWYDK